jgi:hypothetical protein
MKRVHRFLHWLPLYLAYGWRRDSVQEQWESQQSYFCVCLNAYGWEQMEMWTVERALNLNLGLSSCLVLGQDQRWLDSPYQLAPLGFAAPCRALVGAQNGIYNGEERQAQAECLRQECE